jgi:hypothetical protein
MGAPLSIKLATWAHPYQSSKQHGCALINQVSNMGAPLLVSKAKFYHLHTSTGLSPSTSHSLGLPPSSLSQQLVLPPPSHQDQQRHTHPSTHLGYGCLSVRPLASVWTFGDHPGSHTEVRIKHDFTSVPKSSWLWRKLHQKVQLFQCEGGGMLYCPSCWVAYKRKSRGA